jgi:hypothetical protein
LSALGFSMSTFIPLSSSSFSFAATGRNMYLQSVCDGCFSFSL